MPSREFTIDLVRRLFRGIKDKVGKPYYQHCERVAGYLGDVSDDVWHAAMLHDVLEDTRVTAEMLHLFGYSDRTITLIVGLKRHVGENYQSYIRVIAASHDADLIRIKLADNRDNSDPARIAALPEQERGITRRYERARRALESGLLA